ncbi:c-type cytochrome [Mesorhizobium abyssinicae]|uniref:c-type cytochrome n=1 Tax=Mesorhizobium abyssinicae TaxID=1209958 RepID=UPI003CECCF77
MKYLFVGATVVLALPPPVARARDIEGGKAVFKKCAACHNADTEVNKVGPSLKGVVGRTAETLLGYSYSKAVKDVGAEGLAWDEPNLMEYLANPKEKVPASKMGFPGLESRGRQKRHRLSQEYVRLETFGRCASRTSQRRKRSCFTL